MQNKWGNKNEVLSDILHKYIWMNNRLNSHLHIHWKKLFTLKKPSTFANHWWRNQVIHLLLQKRKEKHLKKKEILRKGPVSLLKVLLGGNF